MTDQELYTGISEKRNEAFLFLYNNQMETIVKMVKQNSGTEDEAMDIFQEGMIAIWVNIQKGKYSLDSSTKVSTYFYSICRNLWLKKIRDSKKIVSMSNYTEQVMQEDDDNSEDYLQVKKLQSNFKKLGEKCQKILNLYYYKKASMKEIAAQLNYEEKSAKNEKYRCMKRLRAMYN